MHFVLLVLCVALLGEFTKGYHIAQCCSHDSGMRVSEVAGATDFAFHDLCSSGKVHIRLPPTLNPNPASTKWIAPPPSWHYGNWKVTYSSQPLYAPTMNMQYDASPVFPQSSEFPGRNNDLGSFQLINSSTIITSYGIDTPRRTNNRTLGAEWDAVYDFSGTGILAGTKNTWEVLAWGYDECGDGYMVIYDTTINTFHSLPAIDIESRSETGPTPETIEKIFKALRSLKNGEIDALANQTMKLVHNGARNGLRIGSLLLKVRMVAHTNHGTLRTMEEVQFQDRFAFGRYVAISRPDWPRQLPYCLKKATRIMSSSLDGKTCSPAVSRVRAKSMICSTPISRSASLTHYEMTPAVSRPKNVTDALLSALDDIKLDKKKGHRRVRSHALPAAKTDVLNNPPPIKLKHRAVKARRESLPAKLPSDFLIADDDRHHVLGWELNEDMCKQILTQLGRDTRHATSKDMVRIVRDYLIRKSGYRHMSLRCALPRHAYFKGINMEWQQIYILTIATTEPDSDTPTESQLKNLTTLMGKPLWHREYMPKDQSHLNEISLEWDEGDLMRS
ncbi:hypothetical protein K474DRAFT_1697794 [Panus rudis PR-1116 ss-1]|nr:hypothetical protein K474DRAFT_1697794 [Panus rudis PR-1116 ss-1]